MVVLGKVFSFPVRTQLLKTVNIIKWKTIKKVDSNLSFKKKKISPADNITILERGGGTLFETLKERVLIDPTAHLV